MIYAINLDQTCDAEAAFQALEALGTPVRPFPRTPRYIHLHGPDGLHDQIAAVTGVCGCCDADAPITPTAVETLGPGDWHIGAVSGLPIGAPGEASDYDGQYGHVTPGPVLLLDSEPADFVPGVTKVHVLNGPGNHGTGTSSIIRAVNPDCPIYAFAVFDANDVGSVASGNAAWSAAADWCEDNPQPAGRGAVVSCSFESNATTDPAAAFVARVKAAGGIIVASTGNGVNGQGIDLTVTPRWPANSADIKAGAMNQQRQRSAFSNYPAHLYAGGEGCEFDLKDGTTIQNASGTSISCPLIAGALRRALDEGRDLAWLLAQPVDTVTNLPSGDTSGAILLYPTNEFNPNVPPPVGAPVVLGDTMQLLHNPPANYAGQLVTNNPSPSVALKWVDPNGAETTDIPVPAGVTFARFKFKVTCEASAMALHGAASAVVINAATGVSVHGSYAQVNRGNEGLLVIDGESAKVPVTPGENYRVVVWHNGGVTVKFQPVNRAGYFEMIDET